VGEEKRRMTSDGGRDAAQLDEIKAIALKPMSVMGMFRQ
jgi:hypothetical protein